MMAPAWRSRRTAAASILAECIRERLDPARVMSPTTSNRSFTETGMPASGEGTMPCARKASLALLRPAPLPGACAGTRARLARGRGDAHERILDQCLTADFAGGEFAARARMGSSAAAAACIGPRLRAARSAFALPDLTTVRFMVTVTLFSLEPSAHLQEAFPLVNFIASASAPGHKDRADPAGPGLPAVPGSERRGLVMRSLRARTPVERVGLPALRCARRGQRECGACIAAPPHFDASCAGSATPIRWTR